mmetsp:Transcript_2196/g.6534  ORF Transcript_2196/g.6534 Transcript_2196/m.6534 type:complete len:751 (-) Transcript_2196:132-2384(-)
MERKRSLTRDDAVPSAKVLKASGGAQDGVDAKKEAEIVLSETEVNAEPPANTEIPAPFRGEEDRDVADVWGKVLLYQRRQLSAKTKEQAAELAKLRSKVEALEGRISEMESDMSSAVTQLTSVQEDLTLTLARVGAGGEDVDADETTSAVAQAILQGDGTSGMHSEILAAKSDATRRLLAQVVELMEERAEELGQGGDKSLQKANDELHARLRRANDTMSTMSAGESKLHSALSSLEEDLQDSAAELTMRRNQVAAFKHRLSSTRSSSKKQEQTKAESESRAKTSSESTQNDAEVQELREKLAQLNTGLETELKRRMELAENLEKANQVRDTPSVKEVLNSALFQTMEANIQQLVLKERQWKQEREELVTGRDALLTQMKETLASEKDSRQRRIDLLEKQLAETTKAAEQAKAARDKFSLQYESRRTLQEQYKLQEQHIKGLEQKQEKIDKELASKKEELEECQKKLEEATAKLASDEKLSRDEEVQRLREELKAARGNADSLYEEMEAIMAEMSSVEKERDEMRSKVLDLSNSLAAVDGQKLSLRQQLISLKEEGKALQVRLRAEKEQNKSLQALSTASKKLTAESEKVATLAQEEVRLLEAKLGKQAEVIEEARRNLRGTNSEMEELKTAKAAAQNRAASLAAEIEQEKFKVKSLEDQMNILKRKLEKRKEAKETSSSEFSTEELLREYRKLRNCSVKTDQPKEVVLLRCGHLFSRQCVDDLVSARNRKCPICGKVFSIEDVKPIYFS